MAFYHHLFFIFSRFLMRTYFVNIKKGKSDLLFFFCLFLIRFRVLTSLYILIIYALVVLPFCLRNPFFSTLERNTINENARDDTQLLLISRVFTRVIVECHESSKQKKKSRSIRSWEERRRVDDARSRMIFLRFKPNCSNFLTS